MLKRVALTLLIILFIIPLTLHAQEGNPTSEPIEYVRTEEAYQMECGMIRLEHPREWAIGYEEDRSFFILSNDPTLDDAMLSPGQFLMIVGGYNFTQLEEELGRRVSDEDRLDPLRIIQYALPLVLSEPDTSLKSSPKRLNLTNANAASFLVLGPFADVLAEIQIIFLAHNENCYISIAAISPADELTQFEVIILHIVESIEFTVSENQE
jgi:hypothetical protein